MVWDSISGCFVCKIFLGGCLQTPYKTCASYCAWCASHTRQVTPILYDHTILQMANQINFWLAILSEQIFFLILYTDLECALATKSQFICIICYGCGSTASWFKKVQAPWIWDVDTCLPPFSAQKHGRCTNNQKRFKKSYSACPSCIENIRQSTSTPQSWRKQV